MVQSGSVLEVARSYESYERLKAVLSRYTNIKEFIREFNQTTTNSAIALEEINSNTLTAMSASKALNVWEKTGHTAANIDLTGTVVWQDATGLETTATFTLDHSNTTTHVALVAAVATARYIRSFKLNTATISTHDLLLGNVAGDEIFAVIKTGNHECLKSGFMAAPSKRSFLGRVKLDASLTTAVLTLAITFTPKGKTLSVTKEIKTNTTKGPIVWEPCIELEPGTTCTATIIDDNAAHPVAGVEFTYVEAW